MDNNQLHQKLSDIVFEISILAEVLEFISITNDIEDISKYLPSICHCLSKLAKLSRNNLSELCGQLLIEAVQ